MAAAALAGEGVTLNRVNRDHLKSITAAIIKSGHRVEFNEDWRLRASSNAGKHSRESISPPHPILATLPICRRK